MYSDKIKLVRASCYTVIIDLFFFISFLLGHFYIISSMNVI